MGCEVIAIDDPRGQALSGVLAALVEAQELMGSDDLGSVVSLAANAIGHLLCVMGLEPAEVQEWADGIRDGLPPLVAGLQAEGGSRFLTASPVS